MAAVHEGFHQEHVVPHCGLDHTHGLGVVEADRLLAEDVLAGLGRLDRPFGVQGMGGGDVDRIYRGIGEQLFVRGVRPLQAKIAGEAIGALLAAASGGHEHTGFRLDQSLGELPGDPAQAD